MLYSLRIYHNRGRYALVSWNWPTEFPEDCPPTQALAANGSYYRIVKSDPPGRDDFVPLYLQNKRRAEIIIEKRRYTLCETLGLSVYATRNDAVQFAGLFPQIGNMIAKVNPTSSCGKVLPTGSGFTSHHTWWIVEGFDPTTVISEVHSP